ncbi:MAG TPA: prepilin-type N-terminal cleavage/methylation domain-containing protein [Sedimentisphaerales bacterium]|nr:prepilin-type N-terminal cleavage/methylation domain-containing protein [Sedimentisphaerales bacterium]
MSNRKNKRGFTLVEVIAASIILCAVVMIAGAIGTHALVGTRLNRRYEMAASVADRQLSLIEYAGIDSIVEMGSLDGDSDELGYPYHWEIVTEYQEIDNLYMVTIIVSWAEGNRPYTLTVDTMFNGTTQTEEAAATQSTEGG